MNDQSIPRPPPLEPSPIQKAPATVRWVLSEGRDATGVAAMSFPGLAIDAVYRVHWLSFKLVCSAVAGNRQFGIRLTTNGGTEIWIAASPTATGAGDTRYQVWHRNVAVGINTGGSSVHHVMGDIVIPIRHLLTIVPVTGTDAGDAYTLVRGLFERIE